MADQGPSTVAVLKIQFLGVMRGCKHGGHCRSLLLMVHKVKKFLKVKDNIAALSLVERMVDGRFVPGSWAFKWIEVERRCYAGSHCICHLSPLM